MILGVDVGNYTTLTSKGINFLSKVCRSSKFQESTNVLKIGDSKVYLGEGTFDTEYRKAFKDNYLNLLYGAIALSTDDKYIQVGVGLPLTQFNQDKQYLRNLILSNGDVKFEFNGVSKHMVINDVEVFPEGVVAVSDDFEGVIIDIGGRTTDICLLQHEGSIRRVYKPYSIPKGMLNLESDFIETINKRFGLDLSELDVNRIIDRGLKIDDKEVDVSFAYDVYKEFTDELVNKIKIDYPVRTYDIALLGGGAETLEQSIINRLPNAFLIEDSFYGNAYGYERELKCLYE